MTTEQITQILKILHNILLVKNSDLESSVVEPVSENEKLANKSDCGHRDVERVSESEKLANN